MPSYSSYRQNLDDYKAAYNSVQWSGRAMMKAREEYYRWKALEQEAKDMKRAKFKKWKNLVGAYQRNKERLNRLGNDPDL